MIGDGVNDVLPIKRADLGIALGEGSAAARTVAGLVLENNSFELLPAALDEGRTIVRNVGRAAKLFLLKNVYTMVLIMVGFGALGLPFPYLPQQVTLLNALTIGGPAFLLMLGRHPGAPPGGGFLREVGWFVLTTGPIMGIAGLVVLLVADAGTTGGEEHVALQQTLLLSALVLMGLGSLWRVSREGGQGKGAADRVLRWWPALALFAYAAVMYLPPVGYHRETPLSLGYFFSLTPLGWGQWGLVLSVAAAAVALGVAADRLHRARGGATRSSS
jgi:cation-transporting ATPase E